MRLAVISDVHSNLHALREVARAIALEDVDMVVCAGDIVGYCAFPNECCDIIRVLADHAVLGNHDIAAITQVTTSMNPYAAKAAVWTAKNINDDSREFIESLKTESRFDSSGINVAMFHGSPRSVDEYVFEEDVDADLIDSNQVDLMILGHTHVPYCRSFGSRMIVNPGSVGQPRDSDKRASYAIVDTRTAKCVIMRVDYEIESAAEAIESAGLPEMLADRLFLGR